MDLNQLFVNWLLSYEELTEKLARYADVPAIFNTEFPADSEDEWGGKTQYPRIAYRFDMQVNQERSAIGTLHVTVYTERTPHVIECIENLVRGRLKDVLMKPLNQSPFCVSWVRTEPYLLDGSNVICKDIVFDILEYPNQITTDPDPVVAMNLFIKEMYPDAVVLGADRITDYTDPSIKPVFYCRLENIQSTDGHCMNTISWFNCRLAVHLLCQDAETRLKMIAAVHQKLAIDTEVIMLDQSPLEIQTLNMNNKADYLREGQLIVTGKYGCLRGGEMNHNLSGVGMGF